MWKGKRCTYEELNSKRNLLLPMFVYQWHGNIHGIQVVFLCCEYCCTLAKNKICNKTGKTPNCACAVTWPCKWCCGCLSVFIVYRIRTELTQLSSVIRSVLRQPTAYRPRLLLAGPPGSGQTSHLAPALLHHLDKLPVHRLDLPTLYSISAKTPEESCAQVPHRCVSKCRCFHKRTTVKLPKNITCCLHNLCLYALSASS